MMNDAAISTAGMASLHDRMERHVRDKRMPGLVALVAAGDDVRFDAIGTLAFDSDTPMARDTIFRIASLTKAVIAVAAMTLVEEGKIQLADSIDPHIPELADRTVLRTIGSALDDTVPAHRAITVEDLLTFRLGFGSVMAPPGTYPIQVEEERLQLKTLVAPWPPAPHTPDSWIAALGSLPLIAQPGERWMYNTGAAVLGVLVARVTGQPIEQYMRERIFDPLGMADTSFSVPATKMDRFATAYMPDLVTGELDVLDAGRGGYWAQPPTFPDCSGGLVSTIDDVWAFASMLVNGGAHGSVRVLQSASMRAIAADRLTRGQREAVPMFLQPGESWGLGMAVPANDAEPGQARGVGWDGGTGCTWRSDLDRRVTGILLTQRAVNSPEPPPHYVDFWRGVRTATGSVPDRR